jgi:nucleotide-binding universal stress UspA family protein
MGLDRMTMAKSEPEQMPPPTTSTLFSHILVPLDGSALANDALTYAAGLAKLCGADVTLLMVIPPIETVIETPGESIAIDTQWENRRRRGETYLAALCRQPEYQGLQLRPRVAMGPVAETILDYAEDHAVDLIVMTTHGRSGLSRWVWGSVADKLLRAAPVPVLLVRSKTPERPQL